MPRGPPHSNGHHLEKVETSVGDEKPCAAAPLILFRCLEGRKKEKFVLLDRTSNNSFRTDSGSIPAGIVGSRADVGLIPEKVIRVEVGISKELKRAAVEIVCAGLGYHVTLAPGFRP